MQIRWNSIVALFPEYTRDKFCYMNSTFIFCLLTLIFIVPNPLVTVFIERQCNPLLFCFEMKPQLNTFKMCFTDCLIHVIQCTVTKSQRDVIPVICFLF